MAPQHCSHTLISNSRKLLRTTKEPIIVATMIRTSLEYFQRLPCMSKACDEWEEFEQEQEKDDITSTTWKEFKTLLNRKFLAYDNQQEILQEAGIANSAIEKEEIQDLFDLFDQRGPNSESRYRK